MSTTKEITIFISEDHLISRMGLKMLLEQTSHFKVVGEAEDGQVAVDNILLLKPDVIMMDLGLPTIDGVAATEIIKRELPGAKVLIFTTAEDDESIFSALKAGADGYCLKTISGDMLSTAIHSVLNGAAWLDPGIAKKVLHAQSSPQPKMGSLTQSKLQLLSLVEQGKSMDEIASELRVNDTLARGLLNELLSQLKGQEAPSEVGSTQRVKRPESVNIRTGDVIADHYRIEDRIGHGGMGSVFKASHTIIGRQVAVKTLHEHLASDGDMLVRFTKEAETSAAIAHPNLVTIFDFGLLQGKVPYIVMEFLEGVDLGDLIEQKRQLEPKALQHIFAQVCDGLTAAHDKGIVHRDLKPSNIMLVGKSHPYHVKLVDFGIAKVLNAGGKALTQVGEVMGSPPYMSPEQCCGKSIDHRSDLYSLGCVMYEAYTGKELFYKSTPLETIMSHVNETPSLTLLEESSAPPNLVRVISQLVNKNPSDRPQSAAEVRQILLSE